ncbi:integrase core domain-containing protein [Pectinatus frisingensis]|uniref:integrase core domain-containing protein n=1 Tax=Pectinatus frisingensis TaxID=865 RepID=UPI003D808FDE
MQPFISIEHERISPKTPNLNAHIESFRSILERDYYSKNEFLSYTEIHKIVTEFIDFYVNRIFIWQFKRCVTS